MTVDQITLWIRENTATVTIRANAMEYEGLTITVAAGGKTGQVGPAIGELVEGMSMAIAEWKKS